MRAHARMCVLQVLGQVLQVLGRMCVVLQVLGLGRGRGGAFSGSSMFSHHLIFAKPRKPRSL